MKKYILAVSILIVGLLSILGTSAQKNSSDEVIFDYGVQAKAKEKPTEKELSMPGIINTRELTINQLGNIDFYLSVNQMSYEQRADDITRLSNLVDNESAIERLNSSDIDPTERKRYQDIFETITKLKAKNLEASNNDIALKYKSLKDSHVDRLKGARARFKDIKQGAR